MKKNLSDKLISIFSLICGLLCLVLTVYFMLLKEKSRSEFIFFINLTLLIIFSVIYIFIYLKKNISKSNTNRYDIVREDIERKIIDLQNQLSKTDEQWRKSYHLLLASQSKNNNNENNEIQNLTFLKNFGFSEKDYIIENNLVFYLTSFSMEYDSTYKTCKEICEQMQLKLIRGDESVFSGDIFSQIIKNIVSASLIIANIDGKNPNVFYELGIAHTLGKNVIFISKRNNELPFDIRQHRTIFYSDDNELKQILPKCILNYKKNDLHYSNDESQKNYTSEFIANDYNTFLLEKVEACLEQKNYDKALIYCKEILRKDPTNAAILLTIGKIYSEIGNNEIALEYYNKATNITHKEFI